MTVIVVDDEPMALRNLEMKLDSIEYVNKAVCFASGEEALDWLAGHPADAALLDVNMRRMDGLTCAKRLKELQPDCAVVFVTGYSEYAVEAFALRASGFLVKPASVESVRRELDYIRQRMPLPQPLPQAPQRLRVQCFGNFEVFCDGEPVRFARSKTKELLAYLVDRRGAAVAGGELCAVLWEDKPDTLGVHSMLRALIADLRHSLQDVQAENVLMRSRNSIAVLPEAIDCDFYRYLDMDPAAVNLYRGEYMTQYSWAEMTLSELRRGVQP